MAHSSCEWLTFAMKDAYFCVAGERVASERIASKRIAGKRVASERVADE